MNEIRRIESEADEIARVRAIVGRHPLPPFVVGFDVALGEFDAEPAVWVMFQTAGQLPQHVEDRKSRAKALSELREKVHSDLQRDIADRYPYFRFNNAEPTESSAE